CCGGHRRVVTPDATVDNRRGIEVAGGRTIVARQEVDPRLECAGPDSERLPRGERTLENGQVLEVAAAVSRWNESEPTHLALDVRGSAPMAFSADAPALHGIVGEDVESRHQIRGRNRGRRGLWRVVE